MNIHRELEILKHGLKLQLDLAVSILNVNREKTRNLFEAKRILVFFYVEKKLHELVLKYFSELFPL